MNHFEEKRQKYKKFIAMQDKLLSNKAVMGYTTDELEYLQKPMGASTFSANPDPDYILPKERKERYAMLSNIVEERIKPPVELNILSDSEENKGRYPIPKKPPIKKAWDRKEKIMCPICGRYVTRAGMSQHRRTNIHLVYANANKRLLHLINPALRIEGEEL